MTTTALTRATLPHRKNELYRYTNLSALLKNYIEPSFIPLVPSIVAGADVCSPHVQGRTIEMTIPRDAHVVAMDDMTDNAHQQWTSRFLRFVIEDGATFTLIRPMAHKGAVTDQIHVDVGSRAQFNLTQIHTGNNTARTDVMVYLNHESCADITALNILSYAGHGDLTTQIYHRADSSTSRQTIRNVVSGSSRAVYQGKVRVDRDTKKATAQQSCKSILLSNAAEADTKPEFEIYADDVQCTHGVTNGTLDSDSLFYAHARGIPPDMAQQMLIRAFILADLPPYIPDDMIQKLTPQIDNALIEVTS